MHHLNGFLGTISSSGTVSLWSVTNKKLTLICSITDESIRPTCIKMIDSTENRYRGLTDISDAPLKEYPTRRVKTSRPISTTGKVIVEADDNDDQFNEIPSNEIKSEKKKKRNNADTELCGKIADMDVETPISERKSKRTRTIVSKEMPTHKEIKRTKVQLKKTPVKVPPKPIVIRSPNSDDDFETKPPQKKPKIATEAVGKSKKSEKKLYQRKSNAKKVSPNTSIVSDKPATTTTQANKRKSNAKKVSPNTSIVSDKPATKLNKRKSDAQTVSPNIAIVSDKNSRKKSHLPSTPLSGGGTSIVKKETQASTPLSRHAFTQENGNSTKSLKKRRSTKLDMNVTDPSQRMATRNKRKYTM